MTIKEVCDLTGLTNKTVRLYVEKGLVSPNSEVRNGRTFRTWSEEDVRELERVASLRRAWFTMEEIRQMQEDPKMIQTILPAYIAWLHEQQQTLEGLVAAADALQIEQIESIAQLQKQLSDASKGLPLPQVDIEPHFEYMDKLDIRPKVLPPDERLLVFDEKPVLWPFLKSHSRKWAEETGTAANERDTSVRDREPARDPVWLAIIKGILMAISVCLGVACLVCLFAWSFPWKLWVAFLIAVALRGGMGYMKYRQERQAWLDRLRKEQEGPE